MISIEMYVIPLNEGKPGGDKQGKPNPKPQKPKPTPKHDEDTIIPVIGDG